MLYCDLDYDGNGFLTLDDWLFLKRWVTANDLKALDCFRKVVQRKYAKPYDAFKQVFVHSMSIKIIIIQIQFTITTCISSEPSRFPHHFFSRRKNITQTQFGGLRDRPRVQTPHNFNFIDLLKIQILY